MILIKENGLTLKSKLKCKKYCFEHITDTDYADDLAFLTREKKSVISFLSDTHLKSENQFV